MPRLRPLDELAPRLGEELAGGEVLLRALPARRAAMTRLALVLGDQLSDTNPALAAADAVLMIEAPGEATHVWSNKPRIAIFLAAMRHFRDALRARGTTVHYVGLGDSAAASLEDRLREALARLAPGKLVVLEPGEWRLAQSIPAVAHEAGVAIDVLDDPHFLCSRGEFANWASRGGASLRMEFFYRWMRQRHRVLLDADGRPEGGRWNFDAENRKGYPKAGPGEVPPPARFEPDAVTREVIAEVEQRFASHPGSLASFAWPMTRADALRALERFVAARLVNFGDYQDAMWSGLWFGWHSLLSAAINLHLLDPREVIAAAEAAYRDGRAPLPAVEGFIRQILGWREFMRGVYWLHMPDMARANHFGHERALPAWYWSGDTRMACARDAVRQTLEHGYAHHIQRLMVTGLFALLAEIDPRQVADWYLAVYVDAVEWAELPNVAGMALYADGGRYTSKPYIASGAYIDRMSNHCAGCHYAPDAKKAAKAGKPTCPFTVLYWGFIDRHEAELSSNMRTMMMARNVARLGADARAALRTEADALLTRLDHL